MQGAQILRNEAYMEPHRQACGTACYVHTGDILSKEHSPTAKPVVLCVEGEKYAAVTKDAAQRSPSALLRAVSMSNGRWTFDEAVKCLFSKDFMSALSIRSTSPLSLWSSNILSSLMEPKSRAHKVCVSH
jgi:hypothetical protein